MKMDGERDGMGRLSCLWRAERQDEVAGGGGREDVR